MAAENVTASTWNTKTKLMRVVAYNTREKLIICVCYGQLGFGEAKWYRQGSDWSVMRELA